MTREVYVDVGLTAYQRATYIGDAIESVLAQTFDRWRLAVSDNGIGESEVERAIQPYLADPRVSYCPTGRDLSLAQNWTNALNLGAGPYVAVLNDDDRWHPGYLQARVDALEANPECGFAFSEWVDINQDGTETLRAPVRFPEGVMSRELVARLFIRENPVVPPAIVVRRSACESVGAYFVDTYQYCDWELWARLAANFPVFYLARQDNDFRRHPATYTYVTRESPDQLLAMFDHVEGLFTHGMDFELSPIERARTRSHILLRAAADVHVGRGWSGSGATYRRALREYPPTVFTRVSVRMLVKSLLGKRGSKVVARALKTLRRDDGPHSSAPA